MPALRLRGASLACDVKCQKQDCLSDYKRKWESDAGKPPHAQRTLLRMVDLQEMGSDDRGDGYHNESKSGR